MNYTFIKRDVFAREEIIRKLVPAEDRRQCEYCGAKSGRFIYGVETDAGRKYFDSHAFCGLSCRMYYYGLPFQS